MGIGTTVGKGLKNALLKSDGKGSRAANLYTGLKPRGSLVVGGIAAGLAAKVAYEGGLGEQSVNKNNPLSPMSVLDPGGVSMQNSQHAQAINPNILASGRIPSGTSNASNAPTLNATGEMVFGMHNGRHG